MSFVLITDVFFVFFSNITNRLEAIPTNFKALKDDRTRLHCRGELKGENNRLVKSDENFFHRTKQLYNVVNRKTQKFGAKLNKHTITM